MIKIPCDSGSYSKQGANSSLRLSVFFFYKRHVENITSLSEYVREISWKHSQSPVGRKTLIPAQLFHTVFQEGAIRSSLVTLTAESKHASILASKQHCKRLYRRRATAVCFQPWGRFFNRCCFKIKPQIRQFWSEVVRETVGPRIKSRTVGWRCRVGSLYRAARWQFLKTRCFCWALFVLL